MSGFRTLENFNVGYFAELFAIEILGRQGMTFIHQSEDDPQASFDLREVVSGDRYDVKYSSPQRVSHRKQALYWVFDLRNKPPECEHYALVGGRYGRFTHLFVVPSSIDNRRRIVVPVDRPSKWSAYQVWPR